MELSLSGSTLKTFSRAIICLARIGSELVFHASSSQVVLHTLNSSRSAFHSICLLPSSFDSFSLPSGELRCSVLLKSVCAVLRTPPSALDVLVVVLDSPDASKLCFVLRCLNGLTKIYRISCSADPDMQQLNIDRSRFRTKIAVRPRDLARLLANFQLSLQEITVIATEQTLGTADDGGEIGGKAVELRSFIDPTKDDSDMALHTQLWIDPAEEFLHYTHTGDPVDVTFGVKELKAFLSFCEGCEVDIQLFFEKAGEPILMAPRFGFDGGSSSDFDATLVLSTMLASQLHEGNTPDNHPVMASHDQGASGANSQRECARCPTPVSDNPSNHTKIWSELSGSAAKSCDGTRGGHAQTEGNPSFVMQHNMQGLNIMDTSKAPSARANAPDMYPDIFSLLCSSGNLHFSAATLKQNISFYENYLDQKLQKATHGNSKYPADANRNPHSQHHPSNWVGAGDDDDDDEEEEDEFYVQSTPHF